MYVTSKTGTERTYAVENVLEDIPGGGTIAQADFPSASETLKEGALLGKDSNGLFHLVKSAIIAAGGDATNPRISKNHEFKVGDIISDGIVSLEISAINTTNASYDVLTFDSGTLTVYAEDTVLFEASATDTTGSGQVAEATVEDTSGDELKATVPVSANPEEFNGVTLKIEQAADDNLAVAYDVGVLTISLADTTPANNNVAAIQAAVQALGTVEGLDFSSMTFTGTDWDDNQTGATLTTATNDFSGGVSVGEKTPKYTPDGVSMNSVDLTKDNMGCGIMVRGTVRESICPYPLSSALKAYLPLVRFV